MTAQTTLQQDYQEFFGRAIKHIVRDPSLKPLIKSLKGNKVRKLYPKSKDAVTVNKLAQLGIIILYMDNTYNLSELGKELLPILEK